MGFRIISDVSEFRTVKIVWSLKLNDGTFLELRSTLIYDSPGVPPARQQRISRQISSIRVSGFPFANVVLGGLECHGLTYECDHLFAG